MQANGAGWPLRGSVAGLDRNVSCARRIEAEAANDATLSPDHDNIGEHKERNAHTGSVCVKVLHP